MLGCLSMEMKKGMGPGNCEITIDVQGLGPIK